MISLFRAQNTPVYAVQSQAVLSAEDVRKLCWLFGQAEYLEGVGELTGIFVGPRREMITPWSTNAVEITQNMGIVGIRRIEEFRAVESREAQYDRMLHRLYYTIGQEVFTVDKRPDPIVHIEDIEAYNREQGLALNANEVAYLQSLSQRLGRKLTDSEVFGFSQVNSEHCRHKIFNGKFVVDGVEQPETLFGMIKKTTKTNPGRVVSAYTDNCAFIAGGRVEQFAPGRHDTADWYGVEDFEAVISIKAETHNFPTTVEPFNGAATGSGGEIRDRIAGGKGAFPMAGTACYMTAYPRLDGARAWERRVEPRKWLYQTPEDILIKASNGASDFGNKFGQPLLTGSVFTFEHQENGKTFGFDKVIMLAGGVGYGKKVDSLKGTPMQGQQVVLLGGDNYRIGMGGGAVSSVATGEYAHAIELNAIQRSNPEMQRRAYNAIRALSEEPENPIVSIHDHGAGGHLNCLSELVEATGGRIDLDKLPVGDPTLSDKEIVGNESQERMGLVMEGRQVAKLQAIAERERAPMYVIGETTGDMQFTFVDNRTGEKPIDLQLDALFGEAPRTVIADRTVVDTYRSVEYSRDKIGEYLTDVLQIEGVACKDWLTNKVDRSVTGRVALQQCAGSVQLPLNDCAVVALDYRGRAGMATALGHAPVAGMADPGKGSVLAMTEALTNIALAPIVGGLSGISLSANWMWPCKNEGEDARLYRAVKAASDFALELGINIPTGKDSLSMTQKYPDGQQVLAPGTVIVTSAGEVRDVRRCVQAALNEGAQGSALIYVDMTGGEEFKLGGSALAQVLGAVGGAADVPTVRDAAYFKRAFEAVQRLVEQGCVLAGHDVSGGGLITTLLEMTFGGNRAGLTVDLNPLRDDDLVRLLFSEKPALVLQVSDPETVLSLLDRGGIGGLLIARVNDTRTFSVTHGCCDVMSLDINALRDVWYRTSYLLDRNQSTPQLALERYNNYKHQELIFEFPRGFTGKLSQYGIDENRRTKTGLRAAIIREKGCQCERETAWNLHLAGFDVKDVHMTDLICGRETLEDIQFIAFVGGFSNSDVLGSAKGWAGAFLYNPKAKEALDRFYARADTMSVGFCNGCQLMVELGLVTPDMRADNAKRPRMLHNDSHRFESEFVGVRVLPSPSIMLRSLEGCTLGIWVAHGEGKFHLPGMEGDYHIPIKWAYDAYPANPNGSAYNAAAICSTDGRHLAVMPHFERALRPWNWAYYPPQRHDKAAGMGMGDGDEVSPWIEAFVNAREWIAAQRQMA